MTREQIIEILDNSYREVVERAGGIFNGDIVADEIISLTQQDEPSVSEWVSVEERLPKDNEEILFYRENWGILWGWYHSSTGMFIEGRQHDITLSSSKDATHWMPLPNPPKTEK